MQPPREAGVPTGGESEFRPEDVNNGMRSLFYAVSGFLAGVFVGQLVRQQQPPAAPTKEEEKGEVKPSIPPGMILYRFNCWLCSGETAFACKPPKEDRYFQLECCRCGVDNRVKVEAPKQSRDGQIST